MRKFFIVLCAALWTAVFVLVPAQTPSQADPTSGYTEVQRAFLREQFQDAQRLAQSFLSANPSAPERTRVHIWMALSLDKLQRPAEAIRTLQDVESRLNPHDPSLAEVLYWRGEISRQALQMLQARMAYQRLLDEFPASVWAFRAELGLGLVFLHEQSFMEARAHFRSVAERFKGTRSGQDARLYEGVCAIQLQDYAAAVSVLQPIVEQLRDASAQSRASFYLGEALTKLERFTEAMAAYRKAVKSDSTSEWSRLANFGLGWAAYRSGDCKVSTAAFDAYLKPAGGSYRTEALLAQGDCLSQMGRADEAQRRFERVLAQEGGQKLTLENGLAIADAYRRQGRPERAHDVLKRLLSDYPSLDEQDRIQLARARVWLEAGQAEDAEEVLRVILDRRASRLRAPALSVMGDVEMYKGHLPQARRYYDDVLLSGADSALRAYATYQLGRVALQEGETAEAISAFERVVAGSDKNLADDARLALALAHLNQQEPQLAREQLSALRQSHPDSSTGARAAYYLAVLALDEGYTQAAIGLCQEAIGQAPNAEESVDATLLLAEIRASQKSTPDAMRWLKQVYDESSRPIGHRAKIAKRLGDFARSEGAYVKAIWWYDVAEQLWPALSGEMIYRTASCFEEAGDLEVALNRYQAIQTEPWHIRGQLAAAKLLERENRNQEAIKLYQALAAKDIPEAKIAKDRAEALRD